MNPFLRVIKALNDHGVRYVIVGGFAAYLHGNRRITVDLDIVVDLDPSEARKAVDAVLSTGMQPRLPVDPYLFTDKETRDSWVRDKGMIVFSFIDSSAPGFLLDLFVREPKDFTSLYSKRKQVTADGLTIPVCGIDDLIEMKLAAGRPQDLLDVEALRTIRSSAPRVD